MQRTTAISFRIDTELAAWLDRDMDIAQQEAASRDEEFDSPVYLRSLIRKGLKAREAERKHNKRCSA